MVIYKCNKKVFIIVTIVVIILIPFIFRMPVKTIRGTYGTYEEKIEFKGLYFTEEYIVRSGDISGLKIKPKNGERISKGTPIADGLLATEAGVMVKCLDGYENTYNLKNIKDIKPHDIDKIVEKNDEVQGIKIINNTLWHVCAVVNGNALFKKGSNVDFVVNDTQYSGQIIEIVKKDNRTVLILKVKDDLDIVNLHRGFNGYIIKSRHEGLIVPKEALTKYNDVTGVFIKQNGYAVFKSVKIIYQGKDMAVIFAFDDKKGVNENDDLIFNPKGIKDGTKVK